jgi:hypothetical protein
MPYSINRYNGTEITVVEDGTINSTLDIKLIGKNYAGYGEVQNENFVNLLENFSGTSQPPRPISGQLWYDTDKNKLKFFDKNNNWRTTGGAEVGTSSPTGLSIGDLWFDTSTKQLKAYNGIDYTLIGPATAPGQGLTQFVSQTVIDDTNQPHAIMAAVVNDITTCIVSSDEFTLDSGINPIIGFANIKKGITMTNTGSSGVTTTTHRFWGTASDSLKAESLNVDGTYRTATASAATGNTVAARNGSGDIYANVFQGVASSAKYADLAENYLADENYPVGTVVAVGGEAEVTAATYGQLAIGVVSEKPAYLMNKDLDNGTAIALKGRVPVRVIGSVTKGDRLIASFTAGVASSIEPGLLNQDPDSDAVNLKFQYVFGIALESSDDVNEKLIEVVIL